ncbi:MAG: YfcC family protein [Ruminococcaceae bacterium]|nr:YfcC family protein [Oscillospiraceae bacterium]
MEKQKKSKGLGIGAKSFLAALLILLVLMCISYLITFLVPGGAYNRVIAANGAESIEPDTFREVQGGLPFWKWLLSPFLVLGAPGSGTIIAVIAFLLVIGGVFCALDQCGMMHYMLQKIVYRFGQKRYVLMAVIILFFMCMGAFIGSFEECVPLVPIVVGLSVALGFDALTGLGMSLLAIGCGFASGVCNPFTVGVAQELCALPMFSGMWFRLICFAVIYGMVFFFVHRHARRVAKSLGDTVLTTDFQRSPQMDRGLWVFALLLGTGMVLVLSSVFIKALQDYTMIIVALTFLLAGVIATLVSGMPPKRLGACFLRGVVDILPAVLMILMASSIKYTLSEARVLDSILHYTITLAERLPPFMMVLFIYLIVLVMNFFISSGSAKAFLLIPIVVPLAKLFDVSAQLSVLAFAFGDGFSNILYPTNPVLLISLGLAGVSYVKWFKWTWAFQLVMLLATSLLLLGGYAIGYC